MTWIEGFVIPVPGGSKEQFLAHAKAIDALFLEHGALRVVECWGDDVPHGKQTDFYRAVDAREGEVVAFSWVEWPDRQTAHAMHSRMDELTRTDPRWSMEQNPPPFDGRRMIFGGFDAVLDIKGE
jgi:uncharacterized protein YbaA (DUF1428 family)